MDFVRKLFIIAKYCWYNYKTDVFWFIQITISPLFFALISMFIFMDSPKENYVTYVLLGTTIMGMWISTLLGTGSEIVKDKDFGVLELLILSKTPLYLIVLGRGLMHALMGLLTVAEILILSLVFSNQPIIIYHTLWFGVTLVISMFSFSILGLVLSSFFVFLRDATVLSNICSRLIYVICGVMFPMSFLPNGIRVIGYLFSPTWCLALMRGVALNTLPVSQMLTNFGIIVGLTSLYFVCAIKLFSFAEKQLCQTGRLGRV